MNSGQNTTHILLERGTEDRELLAELREIMEGKGTKDLAKKFPRLLELKQHLTTETD